MIRTPEEQHLHELIESYVAPLRSEIKALRKELAEQQVQNLNIPDVIKSEHVVCPHCGGLGEIQRTPDIRYTCPRCCGTGQSDL